MRRGQTAEVLAFDRWMRTGRRYDPGYFDAPDPLAEDALCGLETKFNPYHREDNGQFDFAPGAPAGQGVARATPRPRRLPRSDHVVPGPLATYRDRDDAAEIVARKINLLATTVGAKTKIKLGGREIDAERIDEQHVRLTVRMFFPVGEVARITGRISVKRGIPAVRISDIVVVSDKARIIEKPKSITIFRDTTFRVFAYLDRPIVANIKFDDVSISAGTHVLD